jgi:AcrR family transcriptional regulator
VPRSEQANQAIRDQRRRQLLDAAARLFARNGYAGTRIEDIASAGGASKGLIYHYFGSKEAVFVALVERAVHGTSRLLEAAAGGSGSAPMRLRRLIEQEMEGMTDDRHSVLVLVQALTSDAAPEEARKLVYALGHRALEVTSELIAAGQRTGTVAAGDPDQLAALLHACLQGLAVSAATPAPWPRPASSDSLVRLLIP